ncbi:type I-E CRISPR-associated protein Cse1/CasA [Litchfieldella rifensis]|uniref:Type I-E CRISPR-associated protein Cse1/CasA n=1 Tax=Litchfieldella rifensis TaxID=762643 RepID=A0ABV7LP00_9GAMM
MNLLHASWLPFRTGEGQITYRPPSAIADPEVVDLALPRADFQGAAYQWLIGLLQTALPPEDYADWMELFAEPPDTEALENAFAPFAAAFELDGDGPRFMQDLDLLEQAPCTPVAGLLIEAPGQSTLEKNIDHFIKRGIADEICLSCAAIALFTMQVNAPEGGRGHLTGLRGGGPLTTLVLPDSSHKSLWHKLLLNVLAPERITAKGQVYTEPTAESASVFPWMGATQTSDKNGSKVLPSDVHPLHVYWAMPRRFRLLVEEKPCNCQLCGRQTESRVRELRNKAYGAKYDGPWQHPLTPYHRNSKKLSELPYSRKAQEDGLGYRHWSSFVFQNTRSGGALPAMVVHDFIAGKAPSNQDAVEWGDEVEALLNRPRLWAFGYDMKSNKARGWYNLEMPLVAISEQQQQERLREWVEIFTEFSMEVAKKLREQIKSAWFKRPKVAKGDMSHIDQQFYEATQAGFFRALHGMQQALVNGKKTHMPTSIAQSWYRELRRHALQLFEAHALSGPLEELDMKRIMRARRQLLGWLAGSSKGSKVITNFAKQGGFELKPTAGTSPIEEIMP